MDNFRILLKNDFDSDDCKSRLNALSKSNPNLYQFIVSAFDEASFPGIREDVFFYLTDHAGDFSDDHEYAYNLSQFCCNSKMDPSWYEWLNHIYNAEFVKKIPIVDFCIIISSAVEKDIPLSSFQKLYDKRIDDPLYIFDDLDSYDGGEASVDFQDSDSGSEAAFDENDSFSTDKKEDEASYADDPVIGDVSSPVHEHTNGVVDEYSGHADSSLSSYNRDPEYAELFGSLLTVMTDKRNDERSDMQGKVQNHLTELSVLFSSVFQTWGSDREEMERLEALYKLQQKVLFSQQKKINEMRNIISNLQFQLNEAGKMDIKREELKKKLSEVQSLISSDSNLIGIGEL